MTSHTSMKRRSDMKNADHRVTPQPMGSSTTFSAGNMLAQAARYARNTLVEILGKSPNTSFTML